MSNVRGLRRRTNLDVTPTLTACCPRHPSCVHFRPVLAMLCLRRNEHLNIVDNGMAALQRPPLHQLHHRTELAAPAALSIGAASAEGSDAQPSPLRYDRIGMQNTLVGGRACACACCSEGARERGSPKAHARRRVAAGQVASGGGGLTACFWEAA